MSADTRPEKPIGRPAYGSIGHIHGSRLGPGDHSVHEGQSAYCTTKAPRDKRVFVQTKLDGSCVSVAKLPEGALVTLQRKGYPCLSSPHEQHHMFDAWAKRHADRFDALLEPGERVVGEWLAMAHGTRYDLSERDPFVAFDIMRLDKRVLTDDFYERVGDTFAVPDCIEGPAEPLVAIAVLDSYGSLDGPEGVVYRVEGRKGIDFLAKWVRPDKVDGKYFDEETWNWPYEKWAS